MIKEIFTKFGRRRQKSRPPILVGDLPPQEKDSDHAPVSSDGRPDSPVVPLRSGPMVMKKRDSVEVFNEAVDKLIDKLENINDNLTSQVQQNKELVERMNTLPEMLGDIPQAIAEQREAFSQVAEQLRQKVARDEKVAEELSGIHEKVAVAAETDMKMCDQFGTFSEALNKLDHTTVTQTEWLEHIDRTFMASERSLKNAIAHQQARINWILGISLGVCLLAIGAMVVGIILLRG